MRIGAPLVCVRLEGSLALETACVDARVGVVNSVSVEFLEEDPHIFETGIQSLSVERQDCVRCIADNDDAGVEVVGVALDADQWEVRVFHKLLTQRRRLD